MIYNRNFGTVLHRKKLLIQIKHRLYFKKKRIISRKNAQLDTEKNKM